MPPPDGEGGFGTFNNDQEMSDSVATKDYGSRAPLIKTPNTMPKKYFNIYSDKYNIKNIYVMIEGTNLENLGRIHPLRVGHILHKKLMIKNIIETKAMGKNRVRVQLHSLKDANDLVNNTLLEKENLKAFIPNHILEAKGILRGVDTYFDNEYILANIKSSSRIISVNRLEKNIIKDGNTIRVKKQSVIVVFEGNILANEVRIDSVNFPVERFYGRPTQCYKCLRFGHISKQCRSKVKLCISCGEEIDENIQHVCTAENFCVHCQVRNSHKSTSNICPYFKKQQKIRSIMIDNSLTFKEAEKIHENLFTTVATGNRFDALENNQDMDFHFPPLPKQPNLNKFSFSQPSARVNPSPKISISSSQPSTSNKNSLYKKRKTNPTSSPDIMFPFTFGPPNPLPPNQLKDHELLEKEKNQLINSLSGYVIRLLENIKTMEDIKNLKLDILKKEMVDLVVASSTNKS